MNLLAIAGMLVAAGALAAAPPLHPAPTPVDIPAGPATPIQFAQLTFHSRVVVRVQTVGPPPKPIAWREKKGPHCLAASQILGAAVLAPNSVDLVVRGGDRLRLRFSASCPGLDYYSGFYIATNPDGMICTDRDVIRDRAGGECAVDKIRKLQMR